MKTACSVEQRGGSIGTEQLNELMELLDVTAEVEVGGGGLIYGNYVEMPRAAQIDAEAVPEVLSLLGAPLPFGESESIDYLDLLYEFPVADKTLVVDALGNPDLAWDDQLGVTMTFPDLEASSDSVRALLDAILPGTLYEHDLPKTLRHWQPEPDWIPEDYWDALPADALVRKVEGLRKACSDSEDPTVKEATALAAFSLIESQSRQRVLRDVPKLRRHPGFYKYLIRSLQREAERAEGRKKLLKALEPGGTWGESICHWGLRNALALDLDSVTYKHDVFEWDSRQASGPLAVKCRSLADALGAHVRDNLA